MVASFNNDVSAPSLLAPHKPTEGTAGVFAASLAVVCQMAGLGILQLAYMLAQGGWVCLLLIIGCAFSTNYTGKLLIKCCYNEDEERVNWCYADIGYAAFGNFGKGCAQVFENATLFGVSTLFLILGGKFLEEVVEQLFGLNLNPRAWIAIGGAPVAIPVLVFRTIGEIKFVTFVGVAAVGAVVAAVVVEALMTVFGDNHVKSHTDVVRPEGFVPAFAAMALAFAAHAGLPAVEESMREPKKFALSLNIAYGIVMALYLPTAIIGYAIYGDHVYSPILCSLPRDNWVQVAAKILIFTHVLLTYPVLMTLLMTEVERAIMLEPSTKCYMPKRTLLRFCVVVMTLVVAEFVPYFDTMMSLVGAVCVIMTAFIMPAAFFVKLRAKTAAQRLVPVLIAIIGVVGGCAGALQATIDLVKKVSSGADPNAG